MNVNQWLEQYEQAYNDVRKTLSGKTKGTAGIKYAQLYGNTASQLVTNQMQAEAQRKESELAYKRSLPSVQVNKMQSAGMSRAGAINALNGGGSYTPATISPIAPQPGTDMLNSNQQLIDGINNLSDSFMNMAQIKHQEDVLKEQKRQFNVTLAENKRQYDLNFKENKRLNDATINKLGIESELASLELALQNANYGNELDARKKETLARASNALLEKFKSARIYKVMSERMTEDDLQKIFELQAITAMIEKGVEYDAPKMILEGAKKLSKFLFNK